MSATTPDSARIWQGPAADGSYQDAATGDWGVMDPGTGAIVYNENDPRNG